jgi:hypothetical protein
MRFIVVLLLLTATTGISAQELLFDKTIPEQNVPTASRLKNEMRSHYLNSRYVNQTDFLLQQDFFIAITSNLIVKSKFIKMHSYPSGSFSYEGRLEGPTAGYITFSKYNDRTAGMIMLADGRKYMIDQVASDIFAISLSNESAFTQRESHSDFIEISGTSQPNAATASICDVNSTCPGSSTIDMMVVYTQQTENNWGGAANTIANITQAITNMNISMANSGINNVTFRLVHTTKVAYTESGDFSTDLVRLAGNGDGYMDNVHSLRDQYGADLVSLIIGSPTSSCGIGYLNTNPTSFSADNAFNVSLYSCVVGNFTMAHECGHNMGLRHDWYVDASTTPCSHQHGYVNEMALAQGTSSPSSSRWRTIMAYNDRCAVAGFDCTRINMWANPNLTYNGDPAGKAIGSVEPSDEAYAYYRMACLVAAFRPDASGGGGTECSAPSGLFTSGITTSSATANWSPVSGATSYDVDYKLASSGVWINIASGTTATSWGLLGMAASTSFDWRVRANCSSGSSSYTQSQFTTLSSASCNAPSGLSTLNITTSSATANWSDVTGATSYNVDYKASSSGMWINIASGTTSTSWDLLDMPASTSFDWRVRANCSSGSSGYAQTTFSTLSQLASCSAPTGLSTSGITASAATANWAPVSGAASYNVDYKLATSSSWINIANGTTSLSWTLSGMEATTSYDWRVRANCTSGNSSYTQTQFTTQALGSCNAPGGLSTSNITSSTATVNWSSVIGAFSYTVEYKPTSSGAWITAASATYSTSVNLYALSAATTYDWRVIANCSLTESSNYSTAQFATSGSTPPPPSSTCPGPYDISSNGSIGGAATISLNTDVQGTISPRNDIDHYRFSVSSGGTITVSLTTLPANYNLAVLNNSGTQIGISQNNGTQSETINLNLAAGTYYAKVFPKGNVNSATACYNLRVQTGTATDQFVNPKFTINLFPNPAGDQLNVWVEGIDKKAEIKIYDLMGKLVMQQGSSNTLTQLNISKLSAGFYLVHVNDGKETRSAKFVKK